MSSSLVTWDAGGDVVIGDVGCEKVVVCGMQEGGSGVIVVSDVEHERVAVVSLSSVMWHARGWQWCRHHHHQ